MSIKLKADESTKFLNHTCTTVYTVKKSKCRHYFISYKKKGTKQTAFKRVTLRFINNLFDNVNKMAQLLKAKAKGYVLDAVNVHHFVGTEKVHVANSFFAISCRIIGGLYMYFLETLDFEGCMTSSKTFNSLYGLKRHLQKPISSEVM